MKISVVGLGTECNQITLRGLQEVQSADAVVLKTAKTQTAKTLQQLNIPFVSCDSLYDEAQDFCVLDQKILELLKSLQGKVVFCVNGSGTDDSTVQYLSDKCQVEIFAGVSAAQSILKFSPQSKYQFFCAMDLVETETLSINLPLAVTEIDDKFLASEVKAKLAKFYDDEDEILFYDGKQAISVFLYQLDMQKKYDEKTCIIVRPKNLCEKRSFEVSDLKNILTVLRSENGCPWDKVQTHESLRANVLEEAYELVDAIDGGNIEDIVEETGDNLLQSYFHIVLAEEAGEFDEKEVLTRLCQKLIFRHTHIFGSDKATSSEEALKVWEKNKAIEKGTHTVTDTMHKVAKGLPSLTRALKVQKRASKNKFERTNSDSVYGSLAEEIAELKEAAKLGNAAEVEKRAGDLLFQAVNICRFLSVDPEVALNRAVTKFVNRFEYMENKVKETYENFADAPKQLMEKFWAEAKSKGL